MGKQSRARANRRANRGTAIDGMRQTLKELDQMMADGVVAPAPGRAVGTAIRAALHAHDVLGLRGDALAPYVTAAANAAEAAMPDESAASGGHAWPRGEWPRVSSTAGMQPLARVVEMFGNDEALMSQLRPIAAAEGVSLKDVVVAKRDHTGVLELAFYAPWKGGGFAPIFSVEYQR